MAPSRVPQVSPRKLRLYERKGRNGSPLPDLEEPIVLAPDRKRFVFRGKTFQRGDSRDVNRRRQKAK
jgi:hypothetical protein